MKKILLTQQHPDSAVMQPADMQLQSFQDWFPPFRIDIQLITYSNKTFNTVSTVLPTQVLFHPQFKCRDSFSQTALPVAIALPFFTHAWNAFHKASIPFFIEPYWFLISMKLMTKEVNFYYIAEVQRVKSPICKSHGVLYLTDILAATFPFLNLSFFSSLLPLSHLQTH